MRNNESDERTLKPEEIDEQLKSSVVQKHVLKQSSGHWLTVYPLAVGLAGALGLGILPFSLFGPIALFATIGGLGTGAINFCYKYLVKGEDAAVARVQELREQREQLRLMQVRDIIRKCEYADFGEGAQEAEELQQAYQRFKSYLTTNQRNMAGDSAQRYLTMNDQAYIKGMTLLSLAAELKKAFRLVDVDKLSDEIAQWSREIKRLQREGGNETKIKSRETMIESNQKRLNSISERQDRIPEILAEVEKIESAIEDTHIKLVSLESSGFDLTGDPASQLENAVNAAIKVEQMVRGSDTSEEDKMYREAGKKTPNARSN